MRMFFAFLGASAALQAKTEKKAQSDETIAKGLRALKVRQNVACCMLHVACCMLHVVRLKVIGKDETVRSRSKFGPTVTGMCANSRPLIP
jgi:hypothetical protein